MKLTRCAAAAAIAALFLVGCEQTQQAPPAQPQSSSASSTVAATTDPSLPPADVASGAKPAQDAAVLQYDGKRTNPNPAADTGNDASAHSALTAEERDRQMPMKGQANDYNTPDRAKEGDQPNTASKEPGGQEANPGNQTNAASAAGTR